MLPPKDQPKRKIIFTTKDLCSKYLSKYNFGLCWEYLF